MEIRYNREVDVLVITFTENPVVKSDERKPGIIFDYDANEGIVSIEIMDASEKVTDLERVDVVFCEGSVSTMVKS